MSALPGHDSQTFDELWEELCSAADDTTPSCLLANTDSNPDDLGSGICHSLDDLLEFGSPKTTGIVYAASR